VFGVVLKRDILSKVCCFEGYNFKRVGATLS
jgi:hypothetical protein